MTLPAGLSVSALLIVLGELFAVVALLLVLLWLGGRAIGALFSLSHLEKYQDQAVAVRRILRRSLLWAGSLLALGIIGANAYLLYRGEDLVEITRGLFQRLPTEFWIPLALASGKVLGLVIATTIVLRLVRRGLDVASLRVQDFDGIQANDESIARFFEALKQLVSRAAWLALLGLSARLLGLPAALHETVLIALKIYLIVALGLIIWRAVDAIVATVDGLSERYAHSKELGRYYDRLQSLVPLLRRTIEYLIYLTVATLALLQVEAVAPLAEWGSRLMRILSFFFLTRLAIEVVFLLAEELLTRGTLTPEQKQRRLTFVPLARSVLNYSAYSVFVVIAMKELGIDPTPFLAGAGIVGLAVGFGAQSLITDMVSGLFILIEEYYLIGDFIEVGTARGVVESIDLRTTRIRDAEGRHHILRNGAIGDVINYSKVFTCAVVEVGVAYGSDLGDVTRVLETVGKGIQEAREDVLEPTRVEGVEVFAQRSMVLRTVTRVKPGCHRLVAMDLRTRFKEAFEEHDIEIAPTISLECMPFPNH